MLLSGIAIIYTPRRFPMIMRRTTPAEPSEPVEPAEPLSHAIHGRPAYGLTPNLEPYFLFTSSLFVLYYSCE